VGEPDLPRGITNIRHAIFADLQVEVGTIRSELYAKGLMRGRRSDGWWILLVELADGSYQAKLPGGTKFVSKLRFVEKEEGA
jgi:hypothetical protein